MLYIVHEAILFIVTHQSRRDKENKGMWKAYMKCDITLGIGVCPATIKIIAIPLAMSSQRFLF